MVRHIRKTLSRRRGLLRGSQVKLTFTGFVILGFDIWLIKGYKRRAKLLRRLVVLFFLGLFIEHLLSEVDRWYSWDVLLCESRHKPIIVTSLCTIRLPRFQSEQDFLIVGALFFGNHCTDVLPYVADTFFLSDRVFAYRVILEFSPTLSQRLSTVLPLAFWIRKYLCLCEMFRGFKIELVAVERQIEGRETLGVVGHPKLKWHFCIVE